MRRRAVALALAVSACAAAPEAARPPAFSLDGDGIALVGSPLRVDFGRAEAGAIAAVTRLEGRGPDEVTACLGGVSAARWDDGLALHLRDGAFLGWSRPDGTSAGLACGV